MKKLSFLLLFFMFSGSICADSSVVMNVFVHGTYPAKKLLDHEKSPVRHMIHAEPGLSLAKDLPSNYHFCKAAYGCHECDNKQFHVDHFYTWGWHSSNVRPEHRYNEGKKLYEAVNKQVKKYRKSYDSITVRFIGSSHGGNVVLNVLPWLPFDVDRVCVEVVLLGTPIQEHTRNFINNAYVTKAYSFYSTRDLIQKIDAQKFHKNSAKNVPFWSERTFKDTDQVLQIELKVNGSSISHGKYRRLFAHVPKMLQEANRLQRKFKSNHVHMNFQLVNF